MRFVIISHTLHKVKNTKLYAYEPYVREMNLWLNHVDEVEVVAPLILDSVSEIETAYQHKQLTFTKTPSIAFTSIKKAINSLFKLPLILLKIFKACHKADHIHLRCPGNIGLLGCIIQIFFPKKPKTAKYAGNWDPNAKQPLSYKLQKWILSNTFLTKNMQVLVYGDWKNQSKTVKPFFTASYSNSEIESPIERDYSAHLKFVFVGTLVSGKRPLLAIQILEALHKQGKSVSLEVYGDGNLKEPLQRYIRKNELESVVTLHGNQSKERIKMALKTSHFLMLPSQSEGWPKAVAEAMFFGAIPIATQISCVPNMLDYGNRGILIEPQVENAVITINDALRTKDLKYMSKLGMSWSQLYTLEYFEAEIKKLLVRS
jgi:glycosyltransferase involved in cell wall biosynthesis